MSHKWEIFKTRTLSAIVFVAVMAAGLFINQWSFLLLFLIIHTGCWIEYQFLCSEINPHYKSVSYLHKIAIIVIGTAFILWCTYNYYIIGDINLHILGSWVLIGAVVSFIIIEISLAKRFSFNNIIQSVLGLLYISLTIACMQLLYNMSFHKPIYTSTWKNNFFSIPVFLIFCIWVNDTMAYVVGSIIGKTPLSSISPKKTWEGTLAGIIICMVLMTTLSYYTNWFLWQHALIISCITAVAGTLGDLLESKLKRMAKMKDSGTIMPGHGGFLDRLDSLLLATPFVWLYIHFFL